MKHLRTEQYIHGSSNAGSEIGRETLSIHPRWSTRKENHWSASMAVMISSIPLRRNIIGTTRDILARDTTSPSMTTLKELKLKPDTMAQISTSAI